MGSGTLTRSLISALDKASQLFRLRAKVPEHLDTGRRGEDLAYFYLRENGYTVVARNWRTPLRKGELDLVAWDDGTLAFVEVKTRTRKAFVPAEAAVDRDKQRELMAMARAFLRKHRAGTPYRFDIVSVYMEDAQSPEVALFKDAFGWRTMKSTGRARM